MYACVCQRRHIFIGAYRFIDARCRFWLLSHTRCCTVLLLRSSVVAYLMCLHINVCHKNFASKQRTSQSARKNSLNLKLNHSTLVVDYMQRCGWVLDRYFSTDIFAFPVLRYIQYRLYKILLSWLQLIIKFLSFCLTLLMESIRLLIICVFRKTFVEVYFHCRNLLVSHRNS